VPTGEDLGQELRAQREHRQTDQREHQADQVEQQREDPLPDLVAHVVLPVRHGDRVDERGHRRGPGPQRDEEAERGDLSLGLGQDVGHRRLDDRVHHVGAEHGAAEADDLLLDRDDEVRAEQVTEIADHAQQAQQQRWQRQRLPEGRLGRLGEDVAVPGLCHRAQHKAPRAPSLLGRGGRLWLHVHCDVQHGA
jgi:hypothetical protein